MSNKEYLRIKRPTIDYKTGYIETLVGLAQSEATLHQSGVKSAMPHFIAIVKELEHILGFKFETVTLDE